MLTAFAGKRQSSDMDSAAYAAVVDDNGLLNPMQYACLDGVMTSPLWNGNWFVMLYVVAAAFLGMPTGCDDLFGCSGRQAIWRSQEGCTER